MRTRRGAARAALRGTLLAMLPLLTLAVSAPPSALGAPVLRQPPAKTAPPKPPTKPVKPIVKPTVKAPPKTATVVKANGAPNIVVLLVDDLGWQDISVPLFTDTTEGNRRYRTPAIARLAREGVTFTNAYATAPVGAPSVVTLLTGRGPAVTRVTDDSLSKVTDRSRSVPGLRSPAWSFAGLSAIATPSAALAPLLPKLLRAAGYRTSYVGMPRWSAVGTAGADARSIGFDESTTNTMVLDSVSVVTARAMDAARDAAKPAFILIAFDAPPAGDTSSGIVRALSRARETATAMSSYAEHVERLDRCIGRILAQIDSAGANERTLVVLLSDNGGRAPGAFANAPLRGRMGSAYEGGLRIPFIVRWPTVTRPGLRSAAPVITDDLFPTLLRAARVSTTAAELRGATGQDLTSTLDNSRPLATNRTLFWHYPHAGDPKNDGAEPFSALRSGSLKLIYFYANNRYELYDLADDIGESRDLSLRQPQLAAPLSELLRTALSGSNAQLPVDSAYRRPVGLPGRILVPERRELR